jgi:asparagine synthase (glutamine-hydrolysing)
MCGIAGFVDFARDLSAARPTLTRMAETLRKRGPDAEGFHVATHAALAHRRLIVLDPETGQQPMRFQNTVIVFNGEIYNYLELRKELQGKGHAFVTRSDTEVLLHAYDEWGEDCVTHLNGIFAFALWDEPQGKIFLARDHLGVKPLFYARTAAGLVFGSEIKAILAHPAVRPVVGADGLAHVFAALLSVPGFTVYRDIAELRPASTLTVDARGLRTRKFWQLNSAPHEDSLETTVETIRALLTDTVQRQLIADVPVATMLSGGLDSSGITALAAREFRKQGKPLASFSIDFEDQAKFFTPNLLHVALDTPWALKVSEHAQTEQHTVVVGPDELLEHLMVPTFAHDRPGMGQIETSLFLLCREMKKHATVALSGESADEVFGGYPWFFHPDAVNADTFPWVVMLRAAGSVQTCFSRELLATANPLTYIDRRYREAVAEVPRLPGEARGDERRRELFYHNITRFLPILLDRKDRMSMACGFEVRVPFCDYRLVDYVWNVPWDQKTTGGTEKGVLRRALEDVLPHDVLYRKKNPYPTAAHPAYREAVRQRVLEILNDPNAAVRPYLDVASLTRQAESPGPEGPAPIHAPFEQIIQIEGWLKAYRIEVDLRG